MQRWWDVAGEALQAEIQAYQTKPSAASGGRPKSKTVLLTVICVSQERLG
jgi:hypothetical protein